MPDDYFCPGCGNHSQKEPGNCPLCRTPLETLGDVNVNDDSLESIEDADPEKDIFDDDLGEEESAPARPRRKRTVNYKDNVDEAPDL